MKEKAFRIEAWVLVTCLCMLSATTAMAADSVDAITMASPTPCVADFDCNGAVGVDDFLIFLDDFGRNPDNRPCSPCNPSPVPKTGQTASYTSGDNGNLQMGVVWPVPRFTVNFTCG